jgi:hypothetical protein
MSADSVVHAEKWAGRKLGPESAIALGWRDGRGIQAGRLRLDRDIDAQLRERAGTALGEIDSRSKRDFEPSAHLEDDQVFLLTVADLPDRRAARRRRRRSGQEIASDVADDPVPDIDHETEVSALIEIVKSPGSLKELSADSIRNGTFLFYAVVFTGSSTRPIAFFKRHNAASVMKTGFVLGMLGETITSIQQPVLLFAPDFDLVVDGDAIAALTADAIPRLFADIEVAAATVGPNIKSLAGLPIGLPRETLGVIATACSAQRSLAKRLQDLLDLPHMKNLTAKQVRVYLVNTGQDPKRFMDGNRFNVEARDVGDFLDILQQRRYLGGYDSKLRRADRSSMVP